MEGGAIAGNANFNPRSREWSDRHHRKGRPNRTISIHAPASGATIVCFEADFVTNISIHAPASGATVTSVNIKLSFNISIHAPASGATVNILKQNPNKVYFNPRSREWSDVIATLLNDGALYISIHAPASGATMYRPAGLHRE